MQINFPAYNSQSNTFHFFTTKMGPAEENSFPAKSLEHGWLMITVIDGLSNSYDQHYIGYRFDKTNNTKS